MLLTILYMSP